MKCIQTADMMELMKLQLKPVTGWNSIRCGFPQMRQLQTRRACAFVQNHPVWLLGIDSLLALMIPVSTLPKSTSCLKRKILTMWTHTHTCIEVEQRLSIYTQYIDNTQTKILQK